MPHVLAAVRHCLRIIYSMGITPDVATDVGPVSGQVNSVVAQIALDGIDLKLLATAAGIPVSFRAPVAMFHGTPFASSVVVALRLLLSQFRFVAVDVCSITPDVAQVTVNVALGKSR